MEQDNNDRYFSYFYCVCNDESRDEAEAMLAEVKAELDVDDSTLLSAVVFGLEWDIGESSHIESMLCDMWAGVFAETHAKHDDGEPLFKTFIQCDRLEHGVAGTWKAFQERFGRQGAIAQ